MEIRPAEREDIEGVRRVAERSWEADYPEILSRETIEAGVAEWYAQGTIQAELGNPHSKLLVVEKDGSIRGFAHAHFSESKGTLLRLYVHPADRGRGLGSDLFQAVRDRLASEGVELIRAMVLAENTPGREFYEGLGMRHVDTEETTIGGDTHREAVYQLDIGDG
ncbi:MAG: N-acetyltransferase family protein [Halodesulfurarchaeum sp.]